MNGQEIVTCPNCGSNKVKENPIIKYTLIGAIVLLLIPVVGWISSPLLLVTALATWLVKKQKKIEPMKCRDCKRPFQISVDKHKEYRSMKAPV